MKIISKSKRSVFVIALSVCMVLSFCGVNAFAYEYNDALSMRSGITDVPSGTVPAPGGQVTTVQSFYAAIGGAEAATIDENKITLKEDVYLRNPIAIDNVEIVFDLDGYDVGCEFPNSSMINIRSGSLDIRDTFGRGQIKNSATNAQQSCMQIAGYGKLYVNGGQIGGITVNGGEAIINNGKIYSSSNALNVTQYGKATVNGGEIIGSGVKSGAPSGQGILSEGDLTVNGGTITGGAFDGILSKGKLTLTGGNISSKGIGIGVEIYITNNNPIACAQITGGEISGNVGVAVYNYSADTSKVSLSGGTYKSAVNGGKSFNSNIAVAKSIKQGFKAVDDSGKAIENVETSTNVVGNMSVIEG